mmetsp:Transcript_30116/g.59985  ORF Transcript_30116/g.59985 Transcript_30116/m.59985 type:complete len:443 (+) Transcript_30116:40-1368(+)
MSSGTLPFNKYYRAKSLGEGTYGTVVTVYNDEGNEFALKIFEEDEDLETMELGTLRELSVLRILRCSNGHPNIVEMVDIQTAGEEDCGSGNLSMVMPLYKMGDLKGLVKRGVICPGADGRKQRAEIAHGLLSAVAFLHDNHIIHRDIKTDNVMITVSDNDNGVENFVPVLIDFSLAKFISGPNAVLPPGCTHTGEIGTPTYTAPEVVSRENYGIKSDLWSVGVVLLETLIGELTVDRDKAAARLIEENKASLPESPFVNLIRGLLEQDVDKRLSAREALAMPIFEKFGFEMPPVRSIDLETALTYVGEYSENDEVRNSSKINQKKSSKPQKLSPRERLIKNLCNELECKNPKTEIAAGYYAKVMEQLDDELDDINNSQTLLDCVLAASRFYEEELICLEELQQDDGEYFPSFKNFCLDTFRDNESALLMSLDYSMYLVKQSR